jgi:hypothetical protein
MAAQRAVVTVIVAVVTVATAAVEALVSPRIVQKAVLTVHTSPVVAALKTEIVNFRAQAEIDAMDAALRPIKYW